MNPAYDVFVRTQDACLDGYVMATVVDKEEAAIVGAHVSVLLASIVSEVAHGGAGKTDDFGVFVYFFTAEEATGEDLECSVTVANPNLEEDQTVPCSISVCNQQDNTPTAAPTEGMTSVSTHTGTEDPFYKVNVENNPVACLDGYVSVQVGDSYHNPLVGIQVSVLLVGNHNVGDDMQVYSGGGVTNENGFYVYNFTADPIDAGQELWCSVAIANPQLPFDEQHPCSMRVCDKEDIPAETTTYSPTTAETLDGTSDPFYTVVVDVQDACPDGYVSATVYSEGYPLEGVEVGVLLAGVQSYEGGGVTDEEGVFVFNFTADLVDATGEDLWCSIAIQNPALPYDQQVPCSVKACAQEQVPSASQSPSTMGTQDPRFYDVNVYVQDACLDGFIEVTVRDPTDGTPVVGAYVDFSLAGGQTYQQEGVTDGIGKIYLLRSSRIRRCHGR